MEQRDRFKSLALPYLDRLVSLATRWADGADAEDLVQETYLRAYRAFDQLRDPGSFFAWLCQILRTVAREQYRTRARRRTLVDVVELDQAHEALLASGDPSPLEELLARARNGELRAALRSLPEEFSEALELHDLQGLKYREIAQVTSAPIGTVMSRISRGRRLLAGLLLSKPPRRWERAG